MLLHRVLQPEHRRDVLRKTVKRLIWFCRLKPTILGKASADTIFAETHRFQVWGFELQKRGFPKEAALTSQERMGVHLCVDKFIDDNTRN